MKTSAPRMFSSIWNETSLSGNRRSRAWPERDAEEVGDLLRQLRVRAARKDLQVAESGCHRVRRRSEVVSCWLGRKDSNLRIRDPKSRALPLGHAPPHCGEPHARPAQTLSVVETCGDRPRLARLRHAVLHATPSLGQCPVGPAVAGAGSHSRRFGDDGYWQRRSSARRRAPAERFGQQHPPARPASRATAASGVAAASETGRRRWTRCRSSPPPARPTRRSAVFIWSISGWCRAIGASRSLIICAAREGQGPGTYCGSRRAAPRACSRSASYQP